MWIDDFYFKLPDKLITLEFTSYLFVLFCLLAFIMTRAFKTHLKAILLIILSLFFIYTYGIYHLYFILGISFLVYLLSFIVAKYPNKLSYLSIYLVFFSLLAYFKYFNFNNLIMPLGLSFYSFKAMAYLFDIINQKTQTETNFLYLLAYLCFFPTMIAGPINQSTTFIAQIKKPKVFNYYDTKAGAFQMLLGIFEKLVLCDFIREVVFKIEHNQQLLGMNIILMIGLYSLQIYLDFDSLSNIAIGSARFLGFDLIANFKSPYLAYNLQDFWRRWHRSLSFFFRDYLYIFLGGFKKGLIIKYWNLIIVFVVSGLWHGNSLNFLVWGLLHALILIIQDLILRPFKKFKFNPLSLKLIKLVGILINFVLVSMLWLIFKYSLAEVLIIINKALTYQMLDFNLIGLTINEVYWLITIIVLVVVIDIIRYHFDALALFNRLFIGFRWLVYVALIVIFLVFGVYGGSFSANDFIYRWF